MMLGVAFPIGAVRPSFRPVRAYKSKTKNHFKNFKICGIIPFARVTDSTILDKKVKGHIVLRQAKDGSV